jgi:hypothetical protein
MFSKPFGIILIALGVVMMIYTGFTYVTTEKVVDFGALQINKDKNHFVHWPPIAGAILLVAGIAIVVTAKKK